MARYRIVASRSRVWIEASSNVHPIHTDAEGLEGWLDVELADGKVTSREPSAAIWSFPSRTSSRATASKIASCAGGSIPASTRASRVI